MLQAIGISALAGGIGLAILWAALWTVAFPGVWPGHEALTLPIFLIGAVGGPILLIFGRR